MIAGLLEIQLLANMSRLSDDMRKAERVVGDSMTKVEKSVSSAKQAMSQLGMGLSLGLMIDEVRRTTDIFTKLDAQIKLSTKTQEGYNTALTDIRHISATSQTDIAATTMLYTRLTNVMEGTGVSQKKLADVTSTISFGLKAFGATAQEAASASLQISQAMGANRLGGEEFRAAMEAMPNVMKVLAESMGVPLGGLRQLSIDGKITAEEMVKAWGNPEIAAKFEKLAQATQTITGAWTVAKNELTLLLGSALKTSGFTEAMIKSFKALSDVFAEMSPHVGELATAMKLLAEIMLTRVVLAFAAVRAEAILAAGAQGILALQKALIGLTLLYSTGGIAGIATGILGIGAAAGAATVPVTTLAGVLRMLIWPVGLTLAIYEFGKYALETFQSVRLYALAFVTTMQRAYAYITNPFDKTARDKALKEIDDTVNAVIAMETMVVAKTAVQQEKIVKVKEKAGKDALLAQQIALLETLRAENDAVNGKISLAEKEQIAWDKAIAGKKVSHAAYLAHLKVMDEARAQDQIKRAAETEKAIMNQQQELAKQRQTLTGITGETAGVAGQNALFGLTGDAKVQAELELARQQEDARYTIAQEAQAREMLRMIEQNTWTQDTAMQQASVMEALEQQHQERLAKIRQEHLTKEQQQEKLNLEFAKKTAMEKAAYLSGMLMEMTASAAQHNRALFEINKIAATANAIVKGIEAVQSAYAFGSSWGGPIGGTVMAAIAVAATAANVAAIQSTHFGAGSAGAAASPAAGVPSMANALPAATPATTPTTTPTATATPYAPPREVNIYMRGDAQLFDAKTIREQLIPALNDAVGDGVTINVRQI